jgi:murein DD-endopeptidase MepM/ murein hydrolase activator NlpD
MQRRGLATISLLLLSGCIPRGASYDVQSSGDAAPKAPDYPATAPVYGPEKQIVTPTPAWSPATVQRNAQLVDAKSYIVRSGDTLYRIGNETGAGADAIARANDLIAPYALKVGQELAIPAGLYHRVGAGETGIAIARAYGVSWSNMVSLNNLVEPYILRSGQFLRLPDAASAVPVGNSPQNAQQLADAFSLNIDDIVTGSQPAAPEPGRPSATLTSPIASPASFTGAFAWPLSGRTVGRFGSMGGGRVNDGINIAAALGTPVAAASDGVVVYSGNEITVFGGLILVDHGGGWMTAYGHLGGLNVKRGDRVKRGQAIGSVGNTGYVDTPQLHFEIRKDRKPVDPSTKLPVR